MCYGEMHIFKSVLVAFRYAAVYILSYVFVSTEVTSWYCGRGEVVVKFKVMHRGLLPTELVDVNKLSIYLPLLYQCI